MTKYLDSKFSVGGSGSKEFETGYERTFPRKITERDCTVCEGSGCVKTESCSDCKGTGLRAYQVSK